MGNMRGFDWELEPGGSKLPVLPPRRAEKFGAIEEAARKCEQAEMEENWRLLYVALTRAEERLVIGGSLGTKFRGMPPEKSRYWTGTAGGWEKVGPDGEVG